MQAVYEWQENLMDALDRIQRAEKMIERLPAYFLGLDLGQAADYSALAILERQPRASHKDAAIFHCRHLQRWPLKTSYPDIVEDVYRIATDERLFEAVRDFDRRRDREGMEFSETFSRHLYEPTLAIDGTGVGAPVVDLFKERFKEAERNKITVKLRPVMITGGDTVTHENRVHKVPKRDLIGSAQVALQTERLKISASLPEANTLTNELQNFQVKISLDTAHDSYGAWREGSHDDLVLAVCLALWIAENDKTKYMWAA